MNEKENAVFGNTLSWPYCSDMLKSRRDNRRGRCIWLGVGLREGKQLSQGHTANRPSSPHWSPRLFCFLSQHIHQPPSYPRIRECRNCSPGPQSPEGAVFQGILGSHPVSFQVSLRNAVGSGDGDPDSGTELIGLPPACQARKRDLEPYVQRLCFFSPTVRWAL